MSSPSRRANKSLSVEAAEVVLGGVVRFDCSTGFEGEWRAKTGLRLNAITV